MPVRSYLATSEIGPRMDMWAATAMVANWIEGRRGKGDRETWLVTCFDEHRDGFLEAARKTGVTLEEIEGSGDEERYLLLVGEPGTGWQRPARKGSRP